MGAAAEPPPGKRWKLLVEDCLEAMRWVAEQDKNFHKVAGRNMGERGALGSMLM